MNARFQRATRLCATLLFAAPLFATLVAPSAHAAGQSDASHWFGVIGHSFADSGGVARLEQAMANTGDAELAFVVATGIKGAGEACSDSLYAERRALFDRARRPMIVVPAASDWSDCKSGGQLVSLERLNRMREVFYAEPTSLGRSTIALSRMSANAKFRSYAENAYWVVGNVLYTTLNVTANNNRYRSEAGRNSEFEDRSVANRFWLNKLFALARRKQFDAVVLFAEGDVKAFSERTGLFAMLGRSNNRQDGFVALRRQIGSLKNNFKGKVLLVDTAPQLQGAAPEIEWHENLGHVSVGSATYKVHVTPGAEKLFTLDKP